MIPEPTADLRSEALRLLTNGVYILTACPGDTIHAVTVTWVSQVSFQPPLVLAALRRNSHMTNAVRKARRFALNILGPDQEPLAEKFFEHVTIPDNSPDLSGYAFRPSPARCPLFTDAIGWVECRVAEEPPTPGDHSLILGEVTQAGVRRPGAPMVLYHTPWSYGGVKES